MIFLLFLFLGSALVGQSVAGDIPPVVSRTTPGFSYTHSTVPLFKSGQWLGAIYYPSGASAETIALAETLKTYLLKMGGSSIDVTPYLPAHGGSPGIRLGLHSEWVTQIADDYLKKAQSDYGIVSRGKALTIHGKGPDELRQGMWRFLELLGYRQFFPAPNWEYVPSAADFSLNLGIAESKNIDREQLLGGINSQDLPENDRAVEDWRMKNRIDMGQPVQEYQMWYRIVQSPLYSAEFLDPSHPPYASPTGNKLCVLQPRVVDIVFEYVGLQIMQHPEFLTYSVSAGDRGVRRDFKRSEARYRTFPHSLVHLW
jgi:hypothetical protein